MKKLVLLITLIMAVSLSDLAQSSSGGTAGTGSTMQGQDMNSNPPMGPSQNMGQDMSSSAPMGPMQGMGPGHGAAQMNGQQMGSQGPMGPVASGQRTQNSHGSRAGNKRAFGHAHNRNSHRSGTVGQRGNNRHR